MKQQRIKYKDIIDLGFDEEKGHDRVYLEIFGFDYVIITKNLTKKIYIDWEKETGFAYLIRTDKHYNIKRKRPVRNLEELKIIIDFFTGS